MIETLRWENGRLYLLDQTRLPGEEVFRECPTASAVADGIRSMVVRGAPAIGVTAAYGLAMAAKEAPTGKREIFEAHLEEAFRLFAATRPTAVNLFWAIQKMREALHNILEKQRQRNSFDAATCAAHLESLAVSMEREDVETNRRMGQHGQTVVPDGARILTHCNAGALATAGFGTALGVIYAARDAGKRVEVLADETRPFLQGSRLTAWELQKEGIPVTVICDNMAATLMRQKQIDLVIVGADRIAANGDVANKIGTYGVALAAKAHNIPFYVAAPWSTFDTTLTTGLEIPIEERNSREVTHWGDKTLTPTGVPVRNPAFDMTPADLIAGIITEFGIARPPYREAISGFASASQKEKRHAEK